MTIATILLNYQAAAPRYWMDHHSWLGAKFLGRRNPHPVLRHIYRLLYDTYWPPCLPTCTLKEIKIQVCAPTQNVTIPAPSRAQSCTPKASLHPYRYNQLKFAPVRVLVCTRISVHPSECKPAPVIFAPFIGCRSASHDDCKHEYLGFKRAPLSEKVKVCSPKVQLL